MESIDKLTGVLTALQQTLKPIGVPWLVGGSTGLLLQGVPLAAAPRDLDLYADDEAAIRIHTALSAYGIDEQTEDRSGLYRSILSHYVIDGIKVELVGGFEVSAHGCFYKVEAAYLYERYAAQLSDFAILAEGLKKLRLMPLEHELVFNVLRNRPDRYEPIAQVIRKRNPSSGITLALHDMVSRQCLTENIRTKLRGLVTGNEHDQVESKGVTE